MTTATNLKLLLIEDEPTDAEVVRRHLRLAMTGSHELVHTKTLREGTDRLMGESFDVVLLDLHLPDSVEAQTASTIQRLAELAPVVVMTGQEAEALGEEVVRSGAQDYLVKGKFDAPLLARVVRFAVERARLLRQRDEAVAREHRERELRLLAESTSPPQPDAAAKVGALAVIDPPFFAAAIATYGTLLDLALDRRIFKRDVNPVTEPMRELATQLCARRASPKDLVELHAYVLDAKTSGSPVHARNQALIEEGRLLLLELMGHVIAGYRKPRSQAV